MVADVFEDFYECIAGDAVFDVVVDGGFEPFFEGLGEFVVEVVHGCLRWWGFFVVMFGCMVGVFLVVRFGLLGCIVVVLQ